VTKQYDNTPDGELFLQMREGDDQALVALYRRRQPVVFRYSLQMCGSAALAEDVTQEVFLALIREAHNYDPTRGSLSAFLLGMARNQLLRRLQRERFYAQLETEDDEQTLSLSSEDGPLEEFSRSEMIDLVRRAVLSLPERYREAVGLCDLEEMSYVETAEVLNCAVGTVRSRLHRGRALLLEKLKPVRREFSANEVKTARCFA
jgi:RNA polymerase sigma-70 factor (ECF subfamily)